MRRFIIKQIQKKVKQKSLPLFPPPSPEKSITTPEPSPRKHTHHRISPPYKKYPITTNHTKNPHNQALTDPMPKKSLLHIHRTRGMIDTRTRKMRRNKPLIPSHQSHQHRSHTALSPRSSASSISLLKTPRDGYDR